MNNTTIISERVKFCYFGDEMWSISGRCPKGFRDACVSVNYTHLGDYHSFYSCANNATCLSLNNYSGYPGSVLCCFNENCNHAASFSIQDQFYFIILFFCLILSMISFILK